MMKTQVYLIELNPEQWKLGPLGVGKRNGKPYGTIGPDPTLANYQGALASQLRLAGAEVLPAGMYRVELFFWREIVQYISTVTNKKVTRHAADTTNLQKATEDALQGVLFENDRDVKYIQSEIIEQKIAGKGQVLIVVKEYDPLVNKYYIERLLERAKVPIKPKVLSNVNFEESSEMFF